MCADLGTAGLCCLHGITVPFLFYQPEKQPLEHQVFLLPGFVVQQTGKGVFGGEIPLVLAHLRVSLYNECPRFVLRSWVTPSSHTMGSYQISLCFLAGASLEGEPPQHSQEVKLCLVKLQGNGGENGEFPPLQGRKPRTRRDDGCDGPGYSMI